MTFQFGTALLDAYVLAVLSKEDAYGYSMTQKLKELIDVSESTLYPVLRRLQKEDWLKTYDSQFQGRNRRYYQITEKGSEKLQEYKKEWDSFKQKVESIFAGGNGNDQI